MLVVETLVFDEMQITSKINGNNPTWGGVCHTISSNAARTTVIIKMQNTTGTLSQGSHPGSYNGQDAYNDMLVVDDGGQRGEWATESGDNVRGHKRAGCHARSASDFIRVGEKLTEQKSVVRRLTPMECERLQGMPDDWSKYGINEKGEVYELSDSARYRLQGNGIATPFWRWLLKRISAQYERPATLGSLFDGQASFPMIWEGINGNGSAVWSSEIEKNAIAVAKYHFPEGEK